MNITDNVIRLMVQKINKLPDNTRNLLLPASWIGTKFSPKDLSNVTEIATDEILNHTIGNLMTENSQELQQKKHIALSLIPTWIKQNNLFTVFNTYFHQMIESYFNEDYRSSVELAQLAEEYEKSGEPNIKAQLLKKNISTC